MTSHPKEAWRKEALVDLEDHEDTEEYFPEYSEKELEENSIYESEFERFLENRLILDPLEFWKNSPRIVDRDPEAEAS